MHTGQVITKKEIRGRLSITYYDYAESIFTIQEYLHVLIKWCGESNFIPSNTLTIIRQRSSVLTNFIISFVDEAGETVSIGVFIRFTYTKPSEWELKIDGRQKHMVTKNNRRETIERLMEQVLSHRV